MHTAKLARVRQLTSTGAARSIRLSAQLSLAEVAAETGASVSTVYRWERGQRRPHGSAAVAYGALLDRLLQGGER